MIEFLFLDLDDTILDFQKAERLALAKTLESFGLPPTDTVLARYHEINREHWERLERKELTRQQVLVGRFAALFAEMGLSAQAEQVARAYEENLSQGHYFLPGAEEALKSLSKKYKLYLASNGTARVQAGRLKSAGIIPYFQEIFVSEEMGYNKPDPAYFDACFARIPGFRKDRAMMVGDSLTSDILGGIQAGIATCWVNPHHKTGSIRPDYEIESIVQLEALLKNL
ncbi:MAG TPA: noncanonical pyrimidine nucleotidase, YjjG family [Candidatus Faecousia excrementipullorum]|nr:noncanonical pyrimidine nucleotidase, YjjG family [Candidatus Faecousia excrementipullorum]